MKITAAALQAMNVGFRADFQNAFDAVPKMKDRVAKTVPSSGASNIYGWLKGLTGMREWLGPRLVDNLSEASYTILNRHFEKTVGVDQTRAKPLAHPGQTLQPTICLLYTSPSPRDTERSRMPSSA